MVLEDDDGDEAVAHVVEASEDELVVDGNHPLAGLTLHYRVHVRAVREATAEEIASAASAFDEDRESAEPPDPDALIPLFSLNRSRKAGPPS